MTILPDAREGRFGTPATGEAWFDLRVEGRAAKLADWTTPLIAATHVIPFATVPVSSVEVIAFGPSTVSWRLWLASREDYRKLRAKLGSTDELMVLANLQSQGDSQQDAGVLYDVLPQTTLMALDNAEFEIDDCGGCEVTATFQRQIDPATGLAVPS